VDLIVTDGHDGLVAAVKELFTATPPQRCLVQKQRNVLNAIPRRERGEVQAELVGIWEQPTKPEALIQLAAFKAKYAQRYPEAVRSLAEDEEHLLTFYAFPEAMHRHIQTTNAIESLESQCAPTHRSDRCLHHGEQLLGNCLGHHPGYPLTQNLGVRWLWSKSEKSSQQPAKEGGSAGSVFLRLNRPLCRHHRGMCFLFDRSKR
jgi:Transposase, Mutator family